MGGACCVAARDKNIVSGPGGDILHRNIRYSPSWSFRWDNRGRVAGEDTSISWFSGGISRNYGSDIKHESTYASEDGSPTESFQRRTWQKSPTSEGTAARVRTPTSDQSISRNISMDTSLEQVEESTESTAVLKLSPAKSSLSLPSSSSLSTSPLPSQGHLHPASSTPRWLQHSSRHQLTKPVSDALIPGLKSSKSIPVSDERPPTPSWSNESTRGCHGESSDGWSMHAFSELTATSNRERWSFDNECLGFNHKKTRSSGRNSSFPSADLQTCGICLKLLTEKSLWSSQKLIASNELSVVAVLSCGHAYHAECLEALTPDFYTYSIRFIDASWGFAMGWNYVIQWLIVLPLELTVVSFTVAYWDKDTSVAVWITIFWVFIIITNIFGTLGYAEEEFFAAIFKLSATVIFMFIALVLVCGGGPKSGRYSEYWGARLWYDPGAFQNGFRGFCSVFVVAAFAFSGTELVGLAAAEAKNPAKSLPGAIKQVFWRITLFYILGLTFVGLLVSSKDESLLNAENPYADGTSPFVLAGKYAGLKGFDHFMNIVILVSVMSIGVSCVYGGSRTLTALAQQGYAPRLFATIDRAGRPTWSVAVNLLFGALAYVVLASSGGVVFDWLLALSGLAALFTWGSICLAHIRFRSGWKHQGHTLDEIPFQAIGGVYGSYLGLFLVFVCMAAQFFVAIAPIGGGLASAEDFFKAYLALPVVILFYVVGWVWKRKGWVKLADMDVDTGRREHDWESINAHRELQAAKPAWKRFFNAVF